MKIEIHNQMNLLRGEAVSRTQERIEEVFGKYVRRINSITLTACDLNGPRGGIDKHCRVLVRLNGMGDVVASVDHHSLSSAVRMAIQRVERAVARKIRKNRRIRNASS